jgi:glycosyltransferase involved in cell wall biosynthesis
MSDRLVLAGRLAPEFAALIEREYSSLRQQERLIVIDRWLTERDLLVGYSACDVVCLPYYNFPNISSLMLRAIAAQRHVLVHDFGWMRAIARRFDAASVCDIYDASSFGAAIEGVLERAPQYRFTLAMQALVDYHSPRNFVEHSVVTLRNLLGKPTDQPLTSWASVMNLLEPERRTLY